jgi:hypothetical protein
MSLGETVSSRIIIPPGEEVGLIFRSRVFVQLFDAKRYPKVVLQMTLAQEHGEPLRIASTPIEAQITQ